MISVIIPTYNRAYLLSDAIDSVLNQTYEKFELLVVDDHSTDNTEEVAKSYDDTRVKYLVNKRTKGAQGARNTGLYAAKGDWIAFLDSDDIWSKDKLKIQLDYLNNKQNKNVVGLSTGIVKFNFEKDNLIGKHIPERSSFSTEELLYKNYLAGFSSFICKKEKAIEVGGVDEDFPAMQDMDFYIRLSQVGEVHAIADVLTYVRESNEDRISDNYKKKLEAAKLLKEKHSKLIKNDLFQEANRYGRVLYYQIMSDSDYDLNIKFLIVLFLKDTRHLLRIIKASFKKT